jgi:predicted HAD superfamily Cof-like phosphohydrolase
VSFERVRKWQEAMGLPCGSESFDDPRFKERRMRLIAEECAETLAALTGQRVTIRVGMYEIHKWDPPSAVEFLDGLADLTWVAMGSAAEAGWPFDAAFDEVARSNESKAGGTIDVNGKLTKPDHYSPPNLLPFVARQCCDWHSAKDQGLLDKAKFFAICEPGKP